MNPKIKVTVCTGTACYVLGGSELLLLDEMLPESWREQVELTASECLDVCHRSGFGRPPFAKIDDELISAASPMKIIALLRTKIEGVGN